jgi:hypothetical protein
MPTDVAAASAVRGLEGSGGGPAGGKEAEKHARRTAAAAGQASAEVLWPRWESLHGLAVVIVAGSSVEGQGVEPAWEARVAAVKAACKADMLWSELARASPTAQAAKEAVRKARREAGGSDLEGRQQGDLAARETVLEIAAAWFPDAQARAFREQVDMAREHHMEAIRAAAERWYAPGAAGAVDEPRLSWPAPKAWGGVGGAAVRARDGVTGARWRGGTVDGRAVFRARGFGGGGPAAARVRDGVAGAQGFGRAGVRARGLGGSRAAARRRGVAADGRAVGRVRVGGGGGRAAAQWRDGVTGG